MNKVKVIEGINTTINGLEILREAFSSETGEVSAKKTGKKAKSEQPEETEVIGVGKFDVEQLNSMKYNEFKKLAASLGVKCTGTRDEIMERILELDVVLTDDGGAEVVESVDEEPVKEKKSKKTGKQKKSKESEPEKEKDEYDEQAEALAEETPVEDIIEALAEVDVKATKKNAVSKLAEALREGLIEFEDDEEEDDENEEVESDEDEDEETKVEDSEEDVEDDEEITAESYFSQYDPQGYNDPKNMPEERAEAVVAKMEEIIESYYEDETLTEEDIEAYIEDNASEDEVDLLGEEYTEEDLLKLYMELMKRTIDNEGEEHEQGEPYEVSDKDVCCGRELKYIKKTKKYVCEHCGTEYEAE